MVNGKPYIPYIRILWVINEIKESTVNLFLFLTNMTRSDSELSAGVLAMVETWQEHTNVMTSVTKKVTGKMDHFGTNSFTICST